ncbi:MAG: short-chain dehydrogenase/reductase [Thermoleophilia bacterium]|nr:short-chain dehydrogenase/reductase [Thermoleophilia bacterium]MCZ4496614.1 short-chain dehydrogenase/reductase [Thermoleophilia bacterium]
MGTPTPGRHAGRVAVITGASRGIGRSVARRLAAEGAAVVVAAKSVEPHATLPGTIVDCVEAIRADGGTASWFQLDVRDTDAVEGLIAHAKAEHGRIDYLFNNAGAIVLGPVAVVPPKKFDLMFQVNVRAAHATAHFALPHMVEQQFGHILNFSPPLHLDPSPGMAPYMVTKLGMTRIAMSIAEEHRGDNIAANTIWPVTMIDTAAVRVNGMGDESQYRTPEIIADAVTELFSRPPAECTGNQFTDEEILRSAGATQLDIDRYWVTGVVPEHVLTIVGEDSLMR